jgi:hypothetical protein
VTEVAPGQFRVHETPVLADPPVYLGDTIEARPNAGGVYLFERVVKRSGYSVSSFLIPRDIADSREIVELAERIEGLGGQTERIFGGFLIIHLPPDAPIEAVAEIDAITLRVRSRST